MKAEKKLFSRLFGMLAMGVLAFCILFGGTVSVKAQTDEKWTDKSATEVAEEMGLGFNIGNTLESTNSTYSSVTAQETAWGNPVITQGLMDAIKTAGFDSVRIPITWDNFTTLENGTYVIDSAFMARVKEVVDYAYNADLVAIINVMHDKWAENDDSFASKYVENGERIIDLWSAIADEFADYDQHLIFECMNEPRANDDWTGNSEAYAAINYLNQVFVSTVRSNGKGYNNVRCLMVSGYAASCDPAIVETINIPTYNGEACNNIMISVHCYQPYQFCLTDNVSTFDPDSTSDTEYLDTIFTTLDDLFLSKGIAVVMGEFGVTNTNGNLTARETWLEYMAAKGAYYGIPMLLWDNGSEGSAGEKHMHLNRYSYTWNYPSEVTALMTGHEAYKWGLGVSTDDTDETETGTLGGSVVYANENGIQSASWSSFLSMNPSAAYFESGRKLAVIYSTSSTSDASPVLIMQSSSNSAWWMSVNADSVDTTILASKGYYISYYSGESLSSAISAENISNPSEVDSMFFVGRDTVTYVYEVDALGTPSAIFMVDGALYYMGTDMPANPSKTNMIFDGWYSTRNYVEGTKVTSLGSLTADITLYAKFEADLDALGIEDGNETVITLDDVAITKLSNTATGIYIQWTAVDNAEGYNVYRKASGGSWKKIAIVKDATEYTDTKAVAGTIYGYAVKAFCGDVLGYYTGMKVTMRLTAPTLSLTGTSEGIKVKWNAAAGANKYYVYRKTTGSSWVKVAVVTENSYFDTDVTPGTNYGYSVRSIYNSCYSVMATMVIGRSLETPVINTIGNVASGMKIKWDAITGANKYVVYKYISGAWKEYATTTSTAYIDTAVSNAENCYYKVKAAYGTCLGQASATAKYARIEAPTVTAASDGSVSFTKAYATYYKVYYKTGGVTKAVKLSSSQLSTLLSLTSGSEYQIYVRAFKTINGADYYSAISNISVVTAD